MIGGEKMTAIDFLNSVKIFDGIINICISIKNNFVLKKTSHYFKNYHKHLTIYNDGTGILINSFDIVFNKKIKEELKRAINISDGKKTAYFPSLTEMMSTDIKERFTQYGFWLYADDNIISNCKEKYWSDIDDNQEDVRLKNDDKEFRWIFRFNYSRIKENKPYHVVYIMSIPDMFPITDGKLDLDSANDINLQANEENDMNSSMQVLNRINNFKYTVSFDTKVELNSPPECEMYDINSKKKIQKLDLEHNIIYNKYTCTIKNPKLGSIIRIRWNVKHMS